MLDQAWALAFAQEWIDAWNSHDMERILAHYTDDFTMSSPLIVERLGVATGTLHGKAAMREYWRPSLALTPPLRFELIDALAGVAQLTIYYHNVGRRMVAETLCFNAAGQVTHGNSQWSVMPR